MFKLSNKRSHLALLAGTVVAAAFLLHPFGIAIYHEISYALHPSAEKAFQYGSAYFDSRAHLYDVDRAEYFYTEARRLDPNHRAVYHELARISFLRGSFADALQKIDHQIASHGDTVPSSYYIRGLILGFMGRYDEAAAAYEKFLEYSPDNWAALNDYAWVLLKGERPREAVDVLNRGLTHFPDNPWLLNSLATAFYELGLMREAHFVALAASKAAEGVTEQDWLTAYPGNDPRIAREGVAALREAIERNIHIAEDSTASAR